jgi:hypothetical protein
MATVKIRDAAELYLTLPTSRHPEIMKRYDARTATFLLSFTAFVRLHFPGSPSKRVQPPLYVRFVIHAIICNYSLWCVGAACSNNSAAREFLAAWLRRTSATEMQPWQRYRQPPNMLSLGPPINPRMRSKIVILSGGGLSCGCRS